MKSENRLSSWTIQNDKVKLVYEDSTTVYVSRTDFDRAFGCIISLNKAEVIRDFAIN